MFRLVAMVLILLCSVSGAWAQTYDNSVRSMRRASSGLYATARGGLNINESMPHLIGDFAIGPRIGRQIVAAAGLGYARFENDRWTIFYFGEVQLYAVPKRGSAFMTMGAGFAPGNEQSTSYSGGWGTFSILQEYHRGVYSNISIGHEILTGRNHSLSIHAGWRRIWGEKKNTDMLVVMLGLSGLESKH